MNKLIIVGVAFAMAGCTTVAQHQQRSNMQASLNAYKACLARNPGNPNACPSEKAAYDADRRALNATMGNGVSVDD